MISSLSLVEHSIWPRTAGCFWEFLTSLAVFCRFAGWGMRCRGSETPLVDPAEPEGDDDAGVGDDGDLHSNFL